MNAGEVALTWHDSAQFPATTWSAVLAAQNREGPEYRAAMNRCIAAYWKPVFCFLLARSHPSHRAEDLTQEFFLLFFERDWIRPADADRGRFRTFLLTILTRFLSDQGPSRAPRQKTFDDRFIAISALITDDERSFEPADHETPEQVFMKQWAHAVVNNVRYSLELWCRAKGRPDWYALFSSLHFPPPDSNRPTQMSLADRFHLNRDQVRYALEQVEAQFVQLLRAEVGQHVASPEDVEAEILELQELLGS